MNHSEAKLRTQNEKRETEALVPIYQALPWLEATVLWKRYWHASDPGQLEERTYIALSTAARIPSRISQNISAPEGIYPVCASLGTPRRPQS
jgi:hypothetical protein